MTGTRSRIIEMPVARKAMASLSEDILPNPVRMPTKTAIGIVKVKTFGMEAAATAQTDRKVADWRTINSRSHPSSRENARNATNVNATRAMIDGKRISLKM